MGATFMKFGRAPATTRARTRKDSGFVLISVVVVRVAVVSAVFRRLPVRIVYYGPEDPRADARELPHRLLRGLPLGLAAPNDEEHAIREGRQDRGVRGDVDRRRVDDDDIV